MVGGVESVSGLSNFNRVRVHRIEITHSPFIVVRLGEPDTVSVAADPHCQPQRPEEARKKASTKDQGWAGRRTEPCTKWVPVTIVEPDQHMGPRHPFREHERELV